MWKTAIKKFEVTFFNTSTQFFSRAQIEILQKINSMTDHWEKYRNFTWFSGMEILRKGSFRIVSGDAETVPFRKISTPGNQVKLRYFSQWMFPEEFSNIFRITIKRIHLGGQWLTNNNTISSKARCNGQKCFQFPRRFCKTV